MAAPAAGGRGRRRATAAIGGYKEGGGAPRRTPTGLAVAAAPGRGREILAGAERVKSVLPVCVGQSDGHSPQPSAPALLELVEPATAVEQIPDYYDDAPRWAPLQKYNTPTMEVPATQPLFVDRSAAVRSRTLVSLVCPAVSILAASVAVVAEQDSRRRCDKAQALGRRRFATSENVGYTWRSVVELSQDEAKADTALWVGFARSILPAPFAAAFMTYSGSFALAAPVASAVAAAQAAYHLTAAEYGIARATESVAAKGRTAAVADAYSKQARKACASALAGRALAAQALVVEVAPTRVRLRFGRGRPGATQRSELERAATPRAAAGHQLAGLRFLPDDTMVTSCSRSRGGTSRPRVGFYAIAFGFRGGGCLVLVFSCSSFFAAPGAVFVARVRKLSYS